MSDLTNPKTVLVLYDYEATKASKLTIKAGEILFVSDVKGKWFVGKNRAGEQGSFPSNFVIDFKKVRVVSALFDFEPTTEHQLEFQEKDVLYAVNTSDSGWWEGFRVGESQLGRFPSNYVAEVSVSEADVRMGRVLSAAASALAGTSPLSEQEKTARQSQYGQLISDSQKVKSEERSSSHTPSVPTDEDNSELKFKSWVAKAVWINKRVNDDNLKKQKSKSRREQAGFDLALLNASNGEEQQFEEARAQATKWKPRRLASFRKPGPNERRLSGTPPSLQSLNDENSSEIDAAARGDEVDAPTLSAAGALKIATAETTAKVLASVQTSPRTTVDNVVAGVEQKPESKSSSPRSKSSSPKHSTVDSERKSDESPRKPVSLRQKSLSPRVDTTNVAQKQADVVEPSNNVKETSVDVSTPNDQSDKVDKTVDNDGVDEKKQDKQTNESKNGESKPSIETNSNLSKSPIKKDNSQEIIDLKKQHQVELNELKDELRTMRLRAEKAEKRVATLEAQEEEWRIVSRKLENSANVLAARLSESDASARQARDECHRSLLVHDDALIAIRRRTAALERREAQLDQREAALQQRETAVANTPALSRTSDVSQQAALSKPIVSPRSSTNAPPVVSPRSALNQSEPPPVSPRSSTNPTEPSPISPRSALNQSSKSPVSTTAPANKPPVAPRPALNTAGSKGSVTRRGRPLPQPVPRQNASNLNVNNGQSRELSAEEKDRASQLQILRKVAHAKVERLTSQKDVEKSQLDAAQTELTRLDNELRAMGVEPGAVKRTPSVSLSLRGLAKQMEREEQFQEKQQAALNNQKPNESVPQSPTPARVGELSSPTPSKPSTPPPAQLSSQVDLTAESDNDGTTDSENDNAIRTDSTAHNAEEDEEYYEGDDDVEDDDDDDEAGDVNWYICYTEEGDEYYYNPDTDDTRWEVPEGVHRALMMLWDAPENPNDMAIEEDEVEQNDQQSSNEGPAPSLNQLSRPISEVVFTAAAVTRCQAIVRGWLVRRPKTGVLAKRRKEWNRKFKAVMREIVNTETMYLNQLKVIVDDYRTPLRKDVADKKIANVNSATLDDVFPSSIDDIKALSEELLKTLNSQLETATSADDLRFGKVFVDFAPRLSVYSHYVKDFSRSIKAWTKLLSNESWQTSLAAIKKKSNSKWDLSMYLIVPVQRVPRYELLLKSLFNTTLQTNADYATCKKAVEAVQNVNARINKDKKAAEERNDVAKALSSIAKLPNDGHESQRLVRQGELLSSSFTLEKERRGQGDRRHAHKSHFFLFDDCLLRCTRRKLTIDKTKRYEFKERIVFSSAFVVEPLGTAVTTSLDGASKVPSTGHTRAPSMGHKEADADADDAALDLCGFALATRDGVLIRRFWCGDDAERRAWSGSFISCLANSGDIAMELKDVDKRVELCRAELSKSKDKKEKERLQSQLKVLEAERATLLSQKQMAKGAGSARRANRPVPAHGVTLKRGGQFGARLEQQPKLLGAASARPARGGGSQRAARGAARIGSARRGRGGIAAGQRSGSFGRKNDSTGDASTASVVAQLSDRLKQQHAGAHAYGHATVGAAAAGQMVAQGFIDAKKDGAARAQSTRPPGSRANTTSNDNQHINNNSSSKSEGWQRRGPQRSNSQQARQRLGSQSNGGDADAKAARLQYAALPPEPTVKSPRLQYAALPPEGKSKQTDESWTQSEPLPQPPK